MLFTSGNERDGLENCRCDSVAVKNLWVEESEYIILLLENIKYQILWTM